MFPCGTFDAAPLSSFQDSLKGIYGSFDTTAQSFEPIYKGAARLQIETMGLMVRRAQAMLEVPSRLAQCRTPHDMFNEQVRFWQTAAQQYTETSNRLAATWMQMFTIAAPGRAAKPQRDYLAVPEPDRDPAPAAPVVRERKVA